MRRVRWVTQVRWVRGMRRVRWVTGQMGEVYSMREDRKTQEKTNALSKLGVIKERHQTEEPVKHMPILIIDTSE